jgi:hypothetical protein
LHVSIGDKLNSSGSFLKTVFNFKKISHLNLNELNICHISLTKICQLAIIGKVDSRGRVRHHLKHKLLDFWGTAQCVFEDGHEMFSHLHILEREPQFLQVAEILQVPFIQFHDEVIYKIVVQKLVHWTELQRF